jgi:hypothetical protein
MVKEKSDGKVVQYRIANAQGQFEMRVDGTAGLYFLSASMIGYAEQEATIPATGEIVEIALPPQPTVLKEVTFLAPRITQQADTIRYLVSSFAETHDRTINDVLKKLPGIEVQQDGKIFYNGRSINHFTIERLNLLGDQYGLATNNISHHDVGSVEIVENYQPVKALQGRAFSSQTALNLALKENAKSKWIFQAGAGAGITPFLWEGNLFAMQIMPHSQRLNLYKTNNTGQNIGNELKVLTIEDLLNGNDNAIVRNDPINILSPAAPSLSEQRTLFNRSHLLSVNNIRKWKEDYQLRIKLSYLNDEQTNEVAAGTTYYFPGDSLLVIDEQKNVDKYRNQLTSEVTLTANKPTYYLNNTLKAEGVWDRTHVNTAGTLWNRQQVKTPFYGIRNNFSLVKNKNKITLRVSSFNSYSDLSQNLNVYTMAADTQRQSVRISDFYSHTNVVVSATKKKWTFDAKTGIKIKTQHLTSTLTNVPGLTGKPDNNIWFNENNYYLAPKLIYGGTVLKLQAELPVSFNRTSINSYFLFTPSLMITYKPHALWSFTLRSGLNHHAGDITQLNEGYILQDYRTLQKGTTTLPEHWQQNYSASISYRNPVKALFMNISATYAPTVRNLLNMQNFISIYMISTLTEQSNRSDTWLVNGNVNKIIDPLKSTVSLKLTYTKSSFDMMRNELLTPYTSKVFTIEPKVNTKLTGWFNLEYGARIAIRKMVINDISARTASPVREINQRLSLVAIPFKKINLYLDAEYLHNKTSASVASLLLLDAGVSYFASETVELQLGVSNLFNKHTYATTSYGSLNRYSNQYIIRPRNILFSCYIKF